MVTAIVLFAMKTLHVAWTIPLVAALSLFLAACGGGSGDDAGTTATTAPASSATAAASPDASATAGTPANGSSPADPAGSPETTPGSTSSPAASESTSVAAATPAPTQDPQRVEAFTNGILGEAQEPLFWMQLITGDIECGPNCPDSLDARWSRAVTVCGEGRWEFRKDEDGYNQEVHGALIDALVESCDMLSAKYSAGGTPDDSDEWREVANGALNVLGPEFQALLESATGG